ncbi:22456_t:CDS:2 [Gigaspora margarita]|uniref:22456_t:CDS:1 n=1 Tax=Gigaspora margarita TaxID=4874 RepID=A0ABN7UTG6_GIGMA|nr:22456_t:CDS:2 [Gigaspora margarita]
MKKKLEEELQYFINEIINNLLAEKYQELNEIDKLIEKQNNTTNKIKKCSQCFTSEIDNKKRNCPNCNAKLPTLTSINQASSSQQLLDNENLGQRTLILIKLTNLDGDVNLSKEIKSFSILAQEKRQMLIKNTLLQQTNTNVWHSIPVTKQEANTLKNENTMRKEELITVINSAVLLKILQEIRDFNSAKETIYKENTNNELTDEKLTNKS